MRKLLLAAMIAAVAGPTLAQPAPQDGRYYDRDRRDNDRGDRGDRNVRGNGRYNGRNYDYNRPDPRYNGYDASRYYREGRGYRERRLGRNDRVYRGNDGRFYCRRTDGTTGLILGGILGGVVGNSLDRGRSSTLGTLLGAGGGALIGQSVDRGNVRCR